MARPLRCAKLAAPLALALALAGCGGGRQEPPLQAPVPPEDCAALYVVAPGNYIVDLAGGAAVVLDPSVREFPLFCAPETAARALQAGQDAGRLPAGDWRVYRLEGGFAELVQPAEAGGPSPYALARRARLADWVSADGSEEGR
ncbi:MULTISPECIES: DVU_2496 family lipoprotein [unclassified Desulfovibrio]|uniref:DVU_2496 family lipoprotein n=1 Tax=unclassified Desulfovibrio TaxID=2593640 RepID=UPI0013EC03FB|nr:MULTISPECIES: DVU_2496 family lipoprotein [unclassified Desulfovibrio]